MTHTDLKQYLSRERAARALSRLDFYSLTTLLKRILNGHGRSVMCICQWDAVVGCEDQKGPRGNLFEKDELDTLRGTVMGPGSHWSI